MDAKELFQNLITEIRDLPLNYDAHAQIDRVANKWARKLQEEEEQEQPEE